MQLTDGQVAHYVSGMRSLKALNCGLTGVGPAFLEAATYGLRLRRWRRQEEAAQAAAQAAKEENDRLPYWEQQKRPPQKRRRLVAGSAAGVGSGGASSAAASVAGPLEEGEEGGWPLSQLLFLRLHVTPLTVKAVEHLALFQAMQLLDVRGTKIPPPTLASIQDHFRLVRLPNEARLFARSNSLLAACSAASGSIPCGCTLLLAAGASAALGSGPDGLGEKLVHERRSKAQWVREWEQEGCRTLLQEAAK
eukprot:TRINITY_DN17688_c0_g1_i1.p1 TRINITY_DN17688_c0_g1~~TRINITY_DN17688_c0_g1_i1.p1  ORF type:complete len:250 (-),score=53.07 TRINITY_DN17688_c0_g1_i1:1266-2015(-)